MFEVGERYEIITGLGEAEGHSVYTVLEVELPLLKVYDGAGHEYIFNTHSPSFVSANKPRAARPSRATGEDGWLKEG